MVLGFVYDSGIGFLIKSQDDIGNSLGPYTGR